MGRHRSLRWAVPVVVVAGAVVIASGVWHPTRPTPSLPPTTPTALLAAVSSPSTSGFSGTVVSHVSLGLPDLPSVDQIASSSPLASLLSGSRTLQVWYGGVDKQRVALLGPTAETDLFRSGSSVWRWDSATREADHLQLAPRTDDSTSSLSALTPSGVASMALGSLRPTTRVTVRSGPDVADRAAYELVLRPDTAATRIDSVRIAVDGQTKIPLGVQIYARGESAPAVDVSYTSIRFGMPSGGNFDFTPPSGAEVRRLTAHSLRGDELSPARVSLTGTSWSAVVGYDTKRKIDLTGLGLGRAITKVSGTWGSGRLLVTSLVSVLLTDDGHVYAGAVDPTALYAAAARK